MARDGKFSIFLSWYNLLGGVERFNFVARKSYGFKIGKVVSSKRDVFSDWDNDFANASIETDVIDIQANETIIVRSQNLTAQQVTAIAQIKLSPNVKDETRLINVTINRGSFTFRTDHEKRHEFEFEITYPFLIIPTL